MSWLKRNLVLAGGILAAVVLLGAAGYFLYRQYSRNSDVTAELTTQADAFRRLNTQDPSVTEENVTAARQEQTRMLSALGEARKFFAPLSTQTNIDTATFKGQLATTVFELEQMARKQGVKIPAPSVTGGPYAFTFGSQYSATAIDAKELVPLSYQLLEIRAMVSAVFEARVHSLVSLRRPPVSKKEQGPELLTFRKSYTNQVAGAAVTPYEITFYGFSSELGAVIDGLLRSPCCFVVKNVNVERAPSSDLTTPDSTEPGQRPTPYYAPRAGGVPPGGGQSTADRLRSRYGLTGRGERGPGAGMSDAMRRRYGLGPAGGVTPGAPAESTYQTPGVSTRRGPETMLNEQLLRITMLVDSIRQGAVAAK